MFRVLFLLLFLFSFGYAHQTGLSYVDIKEGKDKEIDIIYKKPLEDIKAKDIVIRYPTQCTQISPNKYSVLNGFTIDKYKLYCGEKGLLSKRIWVDGLVSSDRGVMVRYDNGKIVQSSLLRSTTPFIHINYKSDNFALFVEYTKLGIVHIWGGFDHLLFVFSLLLLAKSRKILLFSITAFTLSHSITLACGILGLVNVDILYIEAMIALSIVFLARELVVFDDDSLTRKNLWLVTFIFGLLHGFGFSSVLSSIGLPQDEIVLSLFSFNLGIEIGQIIFVIVVGSILLVIQKFLINYVRKIEMLIAYTIGIISSFWLIQRVMLF